MGTQTSTRTPAKALPPMGLPRQKARIPLEVGVRVPRRPSAESDWQAATPRARNTAATGHCRSGRQAAVHGPTIATTTRCIVVLPPSSAVRPTGHATPERTPGRARADQPFGGRGRSGCGALRTTSGGWASELLGTSGPRLSFDMATTINAPFFRRCLRTL